ncbi:MAG TPA: fimbria/pilus outer membrane usher protein [Vicinamibacterales bacterium]|nr:fimbria/pilus outer membrane usher protein [Vicinamibacterales bacterium]
MAGRFGLAVLLAIVPSIAAAQQQPPPGYQRSFWSLVVNDVPKGDTDALLHGEDVWLPVATLEKAGLSGFAGQRDTLMGREHVLLGSLAPDITTRLDITQTVMYLSADPKFFQETRVVLQFDRPQGLVQSRNASIYLNYSATWDQSNGTTGFGDTGLSLFGNTSIGSDFNVTADGTFVRGLSTLTVDRAAARQRLQIGDTIPRSTPLGSSPILAGVSFGRDYSLDPYYYHYPTPTFRGTVRATSDVEVYVNNVLVRRLQIAPGPYRLDRLPLTSGRGDVRIVLRDPLGRRTDIDAGVYLATGLLPKGEQDYEYVAGVIRDDSSGTPEYGDLGGIATHRVGVTDWFTLGVTAEGAKNVVAGGPNVSLRLARLGEFEVHTSVSRFSNEISPTDLQGKAVTTSGLAAYGIYNYISRWLSVSALAQYYDDGYANIWQLPGDVDTPEFYQASAAVPLFRTSSLTYTYETKRSPAGNFGYVLPDGSYDPSLVPSVGHSLRLTGRVLPRTQLSVDVTRTTVRGEKIWSGLAGLNVAIGRTATASATYTSFDGSDASYLDLSKPLPIGRGVGFRLSGSDAESGSGFGEVSVNTAYNQMRASYEVAEDGERKNTSATLAGGVIFAGRGLFFTRPLDTSAAVVEVTGLRRVRIMADNVEVARTGRGGRALVPRLLPYLANRISFNETDIPFDYTIPVSFQLIAPPYRGAAFVKFATARIQGRTGSVRMTIDGREVTPGYGTIVVTLPDGPVESPLNAEGEFFLDLPDGHHRATVTFQDRSCMVEFDATARKGELMQRLGVLRCTASGS